MALLTLTPSDLFFKANLEFGLNQLKMDEFALIRHGDTPIEKGVPL
jgi:hypothetical protein